MSGKETEGLHGPEPVGVWIQREWLHGPAPIGVWIQREIGDIVFVDKPERATETTKYSGWVFLNDEGVQAAYVKEILDLRSQVRDLEEGKEALSEKIATLEGNIGKLQDYLVEAGLFDEWMDFGC